MGTLASYELFSDGHFDKLYADLRKNDEEFALFVLMKPTTFDYILEAIRPQLKNSSYLPAQHLLMTLRYFVTGVPLQSLAATFKMTLPILLQTIRETCIAMVNTLVERHMPPLSEQVFLSVAEKYSNTFPNCIGAIGCKIIKTKRPPDSAQAYDFIYPVALHTIVDAQYKFMAIEVISYDELSDDRLFSNTSLCSDICNEQFSIPPPALPKKSPKFQSTSTLPFVFVANATYPLMSHVMTPFHGDVSEPEAAFNLALSKATQFAERALEMIGSKWRIIDAEIEVAPAKAEDVLKCVCLVHNIVIDLEGPYENNSI